MNHTARIDPTPVDAIDDDVMNEMENIEATGVLEYKPDPNRLTDAKTSDDGFLDGYDDIDRQDDLDDELSFVLGED
jgi:hypothetical protein